MDELGASWTDLGLTALTATAVYVAMLVLSRLFGQRQFSRLTTYDLPFLLTVGALVGRVVLVRTSIVGAVAGMTMLFVLHAATGWLHHHVGLVHRAIQNRPILLVAGGQVLDEGLRRARVSVLELHENLRRAGLGRFEDVEAAIMERTGDISILSRGQVADPQVFTDVRGAEHLPWGPGAGGQGPSPATTSAR